MTDKQLLQQLKALKSITLNDEIKQGNKDVLFSQISNTFIKSENRSGNYLFSFKNIFSVMTQPLLVVAGVFVFLLGSLVLGSGLYENSKPTDSLYIARVISERARLNTTFSESQRDSLALQFASDRAQDIATVLMDSELNTEENKTQVEKLSASFNTEISKVKSQLEKKESLSANSEVSDEGVVSSASSLKDENGMDIYIEENNLSTEVPSEEVNTSSDINVNSLENEISGSAEKLNNNQDGEKMIAEIEKLFSEGKYEEVKRLLEEVKKMY